MPAMTNFGSISQRTAAWAAKEQLEHGLPVEVLARFSQPKFIPKNTSDIGSWRRPIPFAPALTPLVEGVTPPGHAMRYEDVPVQLKQFGDFVEISDKVQDMAEDPVLKDAVALNGEQAAETYELILWGVIRAGTAVAFMNGTQRNQVNTALTGNEGLNILRKVTSFLKGQRAKFVTEMLTSDVKFGSEPVAQAFINFGHTDLENGIRGIPGFVPVESYGQAVKALPYEIGKVDNHRFILSPLLVGWADAGGAKGAMKSASGINADVYALVTIAKNSYGHVALRGANAVKPMVLNPDTPRGGDPLGQRGTVGWKGYWAAVILNQAWIHRIECAVSAAAA